jgi:hypothetical protein
MSLATSARLLGIIVALATLLPGPSAATPQWNLRWRTDVRNVEFRGLELDSIPVTDAVADADGRLFTPDGYAVRCPTGSAWCYFYRPGSEVHGVPVSTTADFGAWGLGVPGLRVKASARISDDVGRHEQWPGTDPPFRLLEGFVEWNRDLVRLQGGRLTDTGRFGYVQWDGARGDVSVLDRRLRVGVYGGWGLARGTSLAITDSALDPLDEFTPSSRQHLIGVDGGIRSGIVDLRFQYFRQVDPDLEDLMTERIGGDLALQSGPLTLTAGSDWDLAFGEWGSAEVEGSWRIPVVGVSAGVKRYRPFFDLWTVWGAFSPVPYRSVHGRIVVAPVTGLELSARGETWKYDETGASSAFDTTREEGERYTLRGTWVPVPGGTVSAGLHRTEGPGAGEYGWDLAGAWDFSDELGVAVDFGRLDRPLEMRYSDSELWTLGLGGRWLPVRWIRLDADVRHISEDRRRPDAASFDWSHMRYALAATFRFSGGKSLEPSVPPAVLQIPERKVPR